MSYIVFLFFSGLFFAYSCLKISWFSTVPRCDPIILDLEKLLLISYKNKQFDNVWKRLLRSVWLTSMSHEYMCPVTSYNPPDDNICSLCLCLRGLERFVHVWKVWVKVLGRLVRHLFGRLLAGRWEVVWKDLREVFGGTPWSLSSL